MHVADMEAACKHAAQLYSWNAPWVSRLIGAKQGAGNEAVVPHVT